MSTAPHSASVVLTIIPYSISDDLQYSRDIPGRHRLSFYRSEQRIFCWENGRGKSEVAATALRTSRDIKILLEGQIEWHRYQWELTLLPILPAESEKSLCTRHNPFVRIQPRSLPKDSRAPPPSRDQHSLISIISHRRRLRLTIQRIPRLRTRRAAPPSSAEVEAAHHERP